MIKISLDVALRIIGEGNGVCVRVDGTLMGDSSSLSIKHIALANQCSMNEVARLYQDHLFVESAEVLSELEGSSF